LLFAPAVGAVLCGFGRHLIGEVAVLWAATLALLVAAAAAWGVFLGNDSSEGHVIVALAQWFESGTLGADWALRVDAPAAVTAVFAGSLLAPGAVLGVFGHMRGACTNLPAGAYARAYASVCVMVFVLLVMALADNLLQLIFGWAGVTFATCLAVGAVHQTDAANRAATRVAAYNGIADTGLLIAACLMFICADSLNFEQLLDQSLAAELAGRIITIPGGGDLPVSTLIGLLLVLSALARAGQFVFVPWVDQALGFALPMVAIAIMAVPLASGIFLLVRFAPFLAEVPVASVVLMLVGSVTAAFAASVACVHRTLRRGLGFSVISQFGMVIFVMGAGLQPVALFFMMSASVVACLLLMSLDIAGEPSADNLSRLRARVPLAAWAFVSGAVSLGIGVLALAGYILPLAFQGTPLLQVCAVLTILAVTGLVFTATRWVGWVMVASEEPLAEENPSRPSWPALLLFGLVIVVSAGLTVIWAAGLRAAENPVNTWYWAAFAISSAGQAPLNGTVIPVLAAVLVVGAGSAVRSLRRARSGVRTSVQDVTGWRRAAAQAWHLEQVPHRVIVLPLTGLAGLASRWFDDMLIDGSFRAAAGRLARLLYNESGQGGLLLRIVVVALPYALVIAAAVGIGRAG